MDDWKDDDFHAPPPPSLAGLIASIQERLAAGETDGAMIDDLRTFVLARMHQGFTQREVEDELTAWGLDSRYAVDLVCSARSGVSGAVTVVSTTMTVDNIPAGYWRNPAYIAQQRAGERAERKATEARRMAEEAMGKPLVDLGLEPDLLPSRASAAPNHRGSGRLFLLMALLTALAGGWILSLYEEQWAKLRPKNLPQNEGKQPDADNRVDVKKRPVDLGEIIGPDKPVLKKQ